MPYKKEGDDLFRFVTNSRKIYWDIIIIMWKILESKGCIKLSHLDLLDNYFTF